MDFRSNKVFDFVSTTRNINEYEKKSKIIRLKWFREYEWLCEKYKELRQKLNETCNAEVDDKTGKTSVEDNRSCLPFPETSSQNYGWLSSKPEFQLERYGNLVLKYPNPMDEITLVGGDVPTLAAGKGFL